MLTVESPVSDFAYEPAQGGDGAWQASLSVFADESAARRAIEDDLGEAGFRLAGSGPLAAILEACPAVLGDVAVVDCGAPDAGAMAALARLDERVARAGARLVVATTLDALEALYLCFERSQVHWLVDTGQGERLVALAEARLKLSARVRDLSDEDRETLERLTGHVAAVAERLDLISGNATGNGLALRSPGMDFHHEKDDGERSLIRSQRPPLPDPRLVRQLIARRHARAKHLPGICFADPAWDMLLDLTAARAEHTRVSVTSLCIASGVPATTALRWIGQLEQAGLVERVADDIDRRRAFVMLTDKAADAMARYFAACESDGDFAV